MALAGLKDTVETMFPKLRGLVPTEEELKDGLERLKLGKVVKISGYHTEIFDMHETKDRNAYAKRMLDLSVRAQAGTVRILINDRQVMTRKDGTTGWFNYLEWMEYKIKDDDKKKEKGHGQAG